MMRVLAVDGGQSGIRMRHSAESRIVEVDGVSRAGDTVALVADAIRDAAADLPEADRVVLGLTTAPVGTADADRLCSLVATATGAGEVWLADDTVTSHCGALSGGWGISLIVGTGVACLAVPEDEEPRAFDGHGYLLGDGGGSFWIGRRAIGEILRARDRGERIALTAPAEMRYGGLDDLHVRLHDSPSPVNDIAQFAREVLDAGDRDPVAGGILDEAAQNLHGTAVAAAAYVGGAAVPLALGGRMLVSGSGLRIRLDSLLATDGSIAARGADADPLEGAMRLGSADSPGRYRGLVHLWNERTAA